MVDFIFKLLMYAVAGAFTVFVTVVLVPDLLQSPDPIHSLSLGFANVYSTTYTIDAILCWLVLAIWVAYERLTTSIRHGWVCVVLGLFPGVAVGLPIYLVLRQRKSY